MTTPVGIFVYEGAGWTQIGLVGENATDVAIAPNDPLTIYAGLGHTGVGGTEAAGLWKGVYDGFIWQWSDISIDLSSVTIDPTNSGVVYAGTRVDGPGYADGQVFKITDSGATWTLLNIEEGPHCRHRSR